MGELGNMEREILEGVQLRKTTEEIAADVGKSDSTVYRILRGMSPEVEPSEDEYRYEGVYVRKMKSRMDGKISYYLTPEGIRALGGSILEEREIVDREEIERTEDVCEFCGIEDSDVLQTHHVVPKSHGGSNRKENLSVLCANCHAKVHALIQKGENPVRAYNKVAGEALREVKESDGR